MPDQPVTAALRAWREGDAAAEERLLELVYPDLHARAARLLRGERPEHTLQPTALVHEAYLRLVDQRRVDWHDRVHFYAIAARLMRRVLLDHARRRRSAKRGSGREPIPLELVGDVAGETPGVDTPGAAAADLESVDRALTRLAEFDAEGARLIELRFFAGLTVEEAATALGCSVPTAVRRWRAARAWLFQELAAGQASS